MIQPVWHTPSGLLASIPAGSLFEFQLEASTSVDAVTFTHLAGSLPPGVSITTLGVITGIPYSDNLTVNQDYKFTIRAASIDGVDVVGIADRTFLITVSGQVTPEFITPAGLLGTFLDSTEVSLQVEFIDPNPSDVVHIELVDGSLPPGLSLDKITGTISGVITRLPPQPVPPVSWLYEFTLRLTDSKDTNLRTFSIFVYDRNEIPLDTSSIDNIPEDIRVERPPFVTSPEGRIAVYRTDNFFAYKFTAVDFDLDPIRFSIFFEDSSTVTLPPGLVLDPDTGWLYGYIPFLGITEVEYDFQVEVYKANNPAIRSTRVYNFNLKLVGTVENTAEWVTPSVLPTLWKGEDSLLTIEASAIPGQVLLYELSPFHTNSLPAGVTLLPTGELAGRPSFNQTTDTFEFTVRSYSTSGLVSVFNTFVVTVDDRGVGPWEHIYIKATPPEADRNVVQQLLTSNDAIPYSSLYRPADPRFGVAKSVVYGHMYGVALGTRQQYLDAMEQSHYRKSVVLGPVRTAQALGLNNQVEYEVVYCPVIDDLVNARGISVSRRVTLRPPPVVNGVPVTGAYPNSIQNMRERTFEEIGQVIRALPLWMRTKQANGRIPGFTPAWVIAYTKPGMSSAVAYSINTMFGDILNKISFDIDRYILDRELTFNYVQECEDVEGDEVCFDWSRVDDPYSPPLEANRSHLFGTLDKYDEYRVFTHKGIL